MLCLRRVAFNLLAGLTAILSAQAAEPTPRNYPFTSAPLEIYDRLSELQKGSMPRLQKDERELLAKAWQMESNKKTPIAKMDEIFLVDAMLFSSGVTDESARKKYHDQFQKLITGARESVKVGKGNRERGELLMKFLHDGVMSKGYVEDQTSFAAVFDTGKFNCVSATAMYDLIGSRLGFKLCPISIPAEFFQPGHATLDMIEGNDRIQVEPTNPDGFDWKTKSERHGVIFIGYKPDRTKGHEIDELGIAAAIYSNRCSALLKQTPPNFPEAVVCGLSALALDPPDEQTANNVLAAFGNWGLEQLKTKQFEEGLRIQEFALRFAPKSESLLNNHRVGWIWYIEAALEAGKDKDAMAIIARAAKADPTEKEFTTPSRWFAAAGEKSLEAKNWDTGLALADRGLALLSGDEAKSLREWRTGVYRRWSQALLQNKDAEGSLRVLAKAYTLDPTDDQLLDGVAFHIQESLASIEEKSGVAAMVEHYRAIAKQFPKVELVADRGKSHAGRAIAKMTDAKKFKEAVEALPKYRELTPKPEQQAELAGMAYDAWAQSFAAEKNWQKAVDIYADGLKQHPEQELLTHNAAVTFNQWANVSMDGKNWDEAIRILKAGLKALPNDSNLQQNLKYCEQAKKSS